jgi:hypothetical protein
MGCEEENHGGGGVETSLCGMGSKASTTHESIQVEEECEVLIRR